MNDEIPQLRKDLALVGEGLVVGQVPVHGVEFAGLHSVDQLVHDGHGQEVAHRVDHQPSVREARVVANCRAVHVELFYRKA
jgi:hypothetical protein